MKRLLVILTVALLLNITSSAAFAQPAQQGIHEPGTGLVSPEVKEQGSGQGLTVTPEPTGEQTELQMYVQDQERQMDQDRMQLRDQDKTIAQDQDRMRLGVAVLDEIERLVPALGPQLSEIAKEMQTANQNAAQAELRLRQRSGLLTFLFGADQTAVAALNQEATQNIARLQQLQKLQQTCPCDAQTKATFQQQIQSMTQEQDRLQLLVNQEKNNFGLFGQFFK